MLQQNKITQDTTIPYSITGCHVLRMDQMETLNSRIQERHQNDVPLAPSFNPRPVQTKYTHFGVLDEYKTVETPIEPDYYKDWSTSYLNKNHAQPLSAATRNGPPLAYYMNLDKETALQRQGAYMFNSKNLEDDTVFQPSERGDLYKVTTAHYSGNGGSGQYSPTENTPYLFDQYTFSTQQQHMPQIPQPMAFNNPTLPRGTAPES